MQYDMGLILALQNPNAKLHLNIIHSMYIDILYMPIYIMHMWA